MSAPTRTLLITGASRGFGRRAAERLLSDHPDLHLLVTARGGRGDQLARELAERSNNPNVTSVPCDLASLESIRTAAGTVMRMLNAGQIPPLRGFLGNAGLQMVSTTRTTADGFEMTFGVNVLANYLILRLLLSQFTTPSRIVIVTSDSHFGDFRHNLGMVPAPRWESADRLAAPGVGPKANSPREGRRAYATSKLALIHLVHALARRLPDDIDVYSYNPGLVPGTGLARDAGLLTRGLFRAVMPILRATPIATGPGAAGDLLAAAVAGPRPGESGSYIDRGTIIPSSSESYDEAREESLWIDAAHLCAIEDRPH